MFRVLSFSALPPFLVAARDSRRLGPPSHSLSRPLLPSKACPSFLVIHQPRNISLSESRVLLSLPATVTYRKSNIHKAGTSGNMRGTSVIVAVGFLADLGTAMRLRFAIVYPQSNSIDALHTHVTTYILRPRLAPRSPSSLLPGRVNPLPPCRLRVVLFPLRSAFVHAVFGCGRPPRVPLVSLSLAAPITCTTSRTCSSGFVLPWRPVPAFLTSPRTLVAIFFVTLVT